MSGATTRGAALLASALLASPAAGAETLSQPYRLSPHVAPGETHMGIRLLGSVSIAPASVDGLTVGGLSGLAWDQDESLLYALSDRGALFHLRPRFEGSHLAGVEVLAAYRLRDGDGRALAGRRADAEALVARHADNGKRGDSVLAVAFERHPRVLFFSPRGSLVEQQPLPERLRGVRAYAAPNKALEALTWLPETGFVTAPEQPLAGADGGTIDLFALDGRRWRYSLAANPNAALVAMEALPDGSLLTLERGHGVMYVPFVSTLRRTRLGESDAGARVPVTTVAILDSSQGWSVDNFEGLARHRELRFFMVSDDNFNELQKTLLVYFALAGPGDAGHPGNVPEFELRQQTRD